MNLSQKLQHTMMMYKGVHRACRPECFHSTVDSGIDVAPEINVAPVLIEIIWSN